MDYCDFNEYSVYFVNRINLAFAPPRHSSNLVAYRQLFLAVQFLAHSDATSI